MAAKQSPEREWYAVAVPPETAPRRCNLTKMMAFLEMVRRDDCKMGQRVKVNRTAYYLVARYSGAKLTVARWESFNMQPVHVRRSVLEPSTWLVQQHVEAMAKVAP